MLHSDNCVHFTDNNRDCSPCRANGAAECEGQTTLKEKASSKANGQRNGVEMKSNTETSRGNRNQDGTEADEQSQKGTLHRCRSKKGRKSAAAQRTASPVRASDQQDAAGNTTTQCADSVGSTTPQRLNFVLAQAMHTQS